MDSTPAQRLMKGQRVRIEGPGEVIDVQCDKAGETVAVTWRPDGERTDLTTTIPRGHYVKHAE